MRDSAQKTQESGLSVIDGVLEMKSYNLFEGGRPLRIAVGIIMLGLLLAGCAGAVPLTVCPSGCAYSSIQAAVNASSSGGTIQVQNSTYYENVNVTKQLTLRGIGMPVVDANGNGSAITLSADGIRLEGFTVIGSSDSSDSPIRQYTNPTAGIKVTSNNNALSGNNASNNSNGIYLLFSGNNTLNGNNVSNNQNGITLGRFALNNYMLSGNNMLIGNTANSNNGSGISIIQSDGNVLIGNTANSNNYSGINLILSGNNIFKNNIATGNEYYNFDLFSDYDNRIDTSNLVDEKPIYYIKNAVDTVYDFSTNAGTFYCINCVNVTIKDLNLNKNGNGILLWNTTRSRIQNINTSNNSNGISLYYSDNNVLINSTASNNVIGILLDHSGNNTLTNNTVSLNSNYGIFLFSYDGNFIYNNYLKNTNNFNTNGITSNFWNITKRVGINIIGGPYLGGNFWAYPNGTGFSQTCTNSNEDGICDSPYILDSNDIDYLPLAFSVPFAVRINITGIPVIGTSTGDSLKIEYRNFSLNDPYNILIIAPNGTKVYYDSGNLSGISKEIIPINWTPSSTGNYTIEAWGRGMIDSTPVYVFDSEVVSPVPELGTIVLLAAGMLGLIGIRRRYR